MEELDLLESVAIEHIPPSHKVYLALFKDVSNADFLREQLLARNHDFEFAFVDATIIISRTHLFAAVFKALTLLLSNSLRTPNVHSEIVNSLGPSSNIAEAYRRFGITSSTQHILVVKVLFPPSPSSAPSSAPPPPTSTTPLPTKDAVWQHLRTHVRGAPAAPSDEAVAALTDWARVRKAYKLGPGAGGGGGGAGDAARREAEIWILGAMALKGL